MSEIPDFYDPDLDDRPVASAFLMGELVKNVASSGKALAKALKAAELVYDGLTVKNSVQEIANEQLIGTNYKLVPDGRSYREAKLDLSGGDGGLKQIKKAREVAAKVRNWNGQVIRARQKTMHPAEEFNERVELALAFVVLALQEVERELEGIL